LFLELLKPPALDTGRYDRLGIFLRSRNFRNGTKWETMAPESNSAGDTPEGHQFSFESTSGMGKNGNRRDKMGKIQSRFSRASFP